VSETKLDYSINFDDAFAHKCNPARKIAQIFKYKAFDFLILIQSGAEAIQIQADWKFL
jgi:hypothetical protein